ncbi:MAG: DUF2075 domain-containing protein [Erysipelotrichaceae bacterium]|nr:DUF2075 domain-containing protein [Erysipelotrichaceae bacterium]
MIVYDGTKASFLDSVLSDRIAIEIEEAILNKLGRHTPKSEFRSWENSLNYMYKVLNDKDIPDDAGIAIEYNIPPTAKRIDFMISGYDKQDKTNLVIIELKQWDKVKAIGGVDALVETFTGGANRRVVHPSYQVWSYAQLIKDYNATVQDYQIGIHPCACLHNYIRHQDDPIDHSMYKSYFNEAPVFTKGQAPFLKEFIKKQIVRGDDQSIIKQVDHGKIRPSKSLQSAIVSMIEGNPEFTMIDDQKVVYEEVLRLAKQCQRDYKKRTIIIEGGPGTGKTVVAVNLLTKLLENDQLVQYVSKNSAPRTVYTEKLNLAAKDRKIKINKASIKNMFKGSGSYYESDLNSVHTLIVDEAHRLNEKSGFYGNAGENQIKEIIHSAYCSVFFIDESQRVTLKDIGSIDEIRRWAKKEGSEIYEMQLQSQFRCNGSDGYLAWLDHVLEIRDTANYDLEGIDFDIRVFDTPNELHQMIKDKNTSNSTARLLAGYCWEWPSKQRDNTNYHDIVIGDFEISWNLQNGEPFAIDENSVNEAGCIHTTQGLEFDYVGVIIGDDMIYKDNRIVTDFTKRAKSDQSVKGIKKLYKANPQEAEKKADEIIKNTYRTLMTRGMKGCYIYCTDQSLREYLKKRISQSQI